MSSSKDMRWVACSVKDFGPVGERRHLIRGRGLTTLCGTTASHPEVWRGNTVKPVCKVCQEASAHGSPPEPVKARTAHHGAECYPHGPDDPCTCPGCHGGATGCFGYTVGCTCDIEWDCEHTRTCPELDSQGRCPHPA